MENQIETIKNKIDIVELIGSFITLKKAGRNYKAICPFHQEKTPSFIVSPERQLWHCFGSCGEGGDIFKFLMRFENISFTEALRELADKAGVRLKHVAYQEEIDRRRDRLFSINNWAANYFHYILQESGVGKNCRRYLLEDRKIKTAVIKKFGLGYAPSSWDSLLKFLSKKGFRREEILAAGLLVNNDQGKIYDRFRGRLIFPLKDVRGRVVGFSGRTIINDTGAKYINTPETLIYHKRETLFGIDVAKDAIKRSNNALLVEGEFDMITPYQNGIENVVAIKGSAVTQEQLLLLKRYVERIDLALDADPAGIQAIKRAIPLAEAVNIEIGVVNFSFAKDPDEAVHKDPLQFKKLVASPQAIYDFIIDTAHEQYSDKDAHGKKKISEEAIPLIRGIKNPVIQSHYINKLARVLEVSVESVTKLLRQFPTRITAEKRSLPLPSKTAVDRKTILDKHILSLMFQSKTPYQFAEEMLTIIKINDISTPSYRQTIEAFLQWQIAHPEIFDFSGFSQSLTAHLRSVTDEIFMYASTLETPGKTEIIRTIREIKRLSLKGQIEATLSQEKPDVLKDQAIISLNNQLREVEKSLSAL